MAQQPSFDIYQFEYRIVQLRNRLYFHLAPKDDRDARKLFVVGHPRTGTGTLHRIFTDNGLDSSHTAGSWKTARHDCFSDRGNYQPLDLLATHYRNSLFLLNTRPAANYIRSRMNQTMRKRASHRMPKPHFTARHIANEILRRNNHFLDFVRMFRERGNFAVANIERQGAFDFICERLELEYEQNVWTNKARPHLDDETVGRIDEGFRLLDVKDEHMNPFIIRPLLDDSENRMLDEFMERHAERVYL